MEKTKNGYYKAVSIINYIGGAFMALYALLFIVVAANGEALRAIYQDMIMEYSGTMSAYEIQAMFEADKGLYTAVIIGMIIGAFATTAVMFVAAARFGKFSNLSDEEANKYWGRCIAWAIVSYFFGGLLVGALATVGLCTIQAVQRKRFLNGGVVVSTPSQNTSASASEDLYSAENLEKMKQRLIKLKELKDSGAITTEEYDAMRAKVLHKETVKEEKQEEVVVQEPAGLDKMAQRLAKLDELKANGALSDEEYQSLREKILNAQN